MTTTTLKLERGPDPQESFCYGPPTHPPATPGEWFARRYPAVVEQWGAPMLEAVVADQQGNRLVKPLELNDNFFASILSDPQLGHSVVYYQPEQQWFFLDPVDQLYHPTSEEKLVALLSALLVRCSEEMPRDVDVVQLFCRFTEEDKLKAVVKRARAVHAADSSFFDSESANRRAGGVDNFSDLARGFVRSTVKRQPDKLLSVGECYDGFAGFCKNNGVEPVARRLFKELVVEIIKEEFALGFRSDLKDAEGRYLRGWKGLTVDVDAVRN
jgi:hypothetical protein